MELLATELLILSTFYDQMKSNAVTFIKIPTYLLLIANMKVKCYFLVL